MKNLMAAIFLAFFIGNIGCANSGNQKENMEETPVESDMKITDELEGVLENEENLDKQTTEKVEEKTELKSEKKQKPIAEIKPLPVAQKEQKSNAEETKQELIEEEPVPEITQSEKIKELPQKNLPNHQVWDDLLRKFVSNSGKVNYSGFQTSQSKLQEYLDDLSKNPPQNDWSRNEKMAYWINAYNAFTVKLIIDNYPLISITKLHGGKPWDVKWIKLGGKTYSLNNIENDILRPKYKDARIHFAVNCAAKSCPPLLNRAWTANNLNSNFEKQTKAFINHSQFNQISENEVKISKIFEWYASDFGNIIAYLNRFSKKKISKNAKVSYMEYDWALNN